MMRGSSARPRSSAQRLLVVDSWPLMEWLKEREPVTARFRELLQAAEADLARLLLSSINLGEVYYNCWNEWDEDRAELFLLRCDKLPIHILHPSQDDVLAAAKIKAKYKCSYADAFTMVLAVENQCPVITGDTDFLKLESDGLLEVDWWGK